MSLPAIGTAALARTTAGHTRFHELEFAAMWCATEVAATHGGGHALDGAARLLLGVIGALVSVALVAIGRTVVRTARYCRPLSRRTGTVPDWVVSLAQREGIRAPLHLVEDERAYSFCSGLLRPRINFSRGLLDLLEATELRAVLWHEDQHARARDPLKGLLADGLAALALPFPLTRALRAAYLRGRELDADRAAVDVGAGLDLAAALLKVTRATQLPPLQGAVVGIVDPGAGLRVRQLASQQPLRYPALPRGSTLASLAPLGIVAGLALGAVGEPMAPTNPSFHHQLSCEPLQAGMPDCASHCTHLICTMSWCPDRDSWYGP